MSDSDRVKNRWLPVIFLISVLLVCRLSVHQFKPLPDPWTARRRPDISYDLSAERFNSIALSDTLTLPVLMYHSFDTVENADYAIAPSVFEAQLSALINARYETVSLDELIAWVDGDGVLPEKPLLITIDDGYRNVYDYAFPILKRHGCKATVFTIGKTFGQTLYSDGKPINLLHYGMREALEMEAFGIDNGCHGWDIHQIPSRDPAPVRSGAFPVQGESFSEFKAFLKNDLTIYADKVLPFKGLAYPHGLYCTASEQVLDELGIRVSLTSDPGVNRIIKGNSKSLRLLKRISAHKYDAAQLIKCLEEYINE